jgi:thymidylate kinase
LINMTVILIDNLVYALNREDLRYCQWKSNFSINESLSGKTDLDLLIDRRSLSGILIILLSLGFKPARGKLGLEPDGIFHFYGMDASTGQLIHVHLFSGVLTGESFVKTHLLPFENMLLENTSRIGEMKVASPAAELVVFVVRTFIKYGSLLDVLMLTGKSEVLRDELTWLQNESELSESLVLLKKYCPVIDEALFLKCLNTLKENTFMPGRVLLAQTVRQHLKIYTKYHLPGLVLAYSQFLWGKARDLLEHRRNKKILKTGGVVIAIVGAEATGKSTLVSEIGNWLLPIFSTRTVHAGKPPSTWMTAPLNALLPFLRRRLPQMRTTRQDRKTSLQIENNSDTVTKGWSGLIYAVRSVSLAWDRRKLLVRARHYAANGDIVICDRYPSENIGTMDSPRLLENKDLTGLKGFFYNGLARLERRFYKEIPPPDLVLKLKVSLKTAIERNHNRIKAEKETDEYLEKRHRQCLDWSLVGTKYIYEIDTEQPLENTILTVERKIWEVI